MYRAQLETYIDKFFMVQNYWVNEYTKDLVLRA